MLLRVPDYLQDRGQAGGPGDGLMYHGYNAANNATSCCKWGRANGWIMMGHVEVGSGRRGAVGEWARV